MSTGPDLPGQSCAHFQRIIIVDFSAAASPGPRRPKADQIWLASVIPGAAPGPAEYFRTRSALEHRLSDLIQQTKGNLMIGWDFPFGYPAGSTLGGGRDAAAALASEITDAPDNRNNRFEFAAWFNRQWPQGPGPFWARPASVTDVDLPPRRPDQAVFPFSPWRCVETRLKSLGLHSVQSVWKLYTTGSVGSQALMGLPLIHRLLQRHTGRVWPFDTDWDKQLDGVIHVECWPSMIDFSAEDHPIRDARQVMAMARALGMADHYGKLSDWLAAPSDLSADDLAAVQQQEGWIAGVPKMVRSAGNRKITPSADQ